MDFLTWGRSPWSQDILLHISWTLLYVAAAAGVLFMAAHAIYVRVRPSPKAVIEPHAQQLAARIPERVARHSAAARAFHWVMAASMLTLLFTAFLPIVGVKFAWVTIHWIAGLVLTASILYHVIHATFWLDFWSIWLTREDLDESWNRSRRAAGIAAPAPPKAGKYPVDNKMYHTAIVITGFVAMITGLFMMTRVRTPLLTRNPYVFFSDTGWGVMYVSHGLMGVLLVTLTLAHVYFAVRPEKFWITKSMLFGWISRRNYLEHHDPRRWVVATPAPPPPAEQERKVAV
jgi:cytochrome b subunit of formate dehydrogenase